MMLIDTNIMTFDHCSHITITIFRFQKEIVSLEHVLSIFKKDFIKRDRLPLDNIEPLDLWTIAIKEYLTHPVNTHQ